MSTARGSTVNDLQGRANAALADHLSRAGEDSLHEAYELGRTALDAGLGVIDIALVLYRAARGSAGSDGDRGPEAGARMESFLLECLAPFEMAHRGTREANTALRRLDEQREQDARRIAADLHDHAGQMLPALGFMIDSLRDKVPAESAGALDRARSVVEQLAERLRRISHELRPIMLDDLGLEPALRFHAEGVTQRTGLAIRVEAPRIGRLGHAIETAVYRAVQEALRNVVRHAGASRAVVELRRSESELTCRIYDDGRGFPPAPDGPPSGTRGFGLEAMRERLAAVRGRVTLGSHPSGGAEITLRIPLEAFHARTLAARG